VDLAWTITADAGDLGGAAASLFGRDDLPESRRCEGPGFPAISGCGCASSHPGPDALAGLALLVLGTRRRRRNAVT
jgi:MYXO-CTERM domain-containing protein